MRLRDIIDEKAPPGKKAKRFLAKTKKDFKHRYGKHWKSVQYATAWKMFGESLMEGEARDFFSEVEARVKALGGKFHLGASLGPHQIRSEISGDRAIEWFHSEDAQRMAQAAGWTLTAFEPKDEKDGLDDQGRQKYLRRMQVRWESNEGEEANDYNTPDRRELYHVTATRNVQAILQRGLEPRPSRRPNMHQYGPRVYLATSLQAAEAIVRNLQRVDGDTHYTILKIDPEMVGPLFVDQEFRRRGVYTKDPIAPQAISVVEAPALMEDVQAEPIPLTPRFLGQVRKTAYAIASDIAQDVVPRNNEKLREKLLMLLRQIWYAAHHEGSLVIERGELRPADDVPDGITDVGCHWSWESNNARVYHHDNAYDDHGEEGLMDVTLVATVPLQAIDWVFTLATNLILPGETEITVRPGATIMLDAVWEDGSVEHPVHQSVHVSGYYDLD